MTSNDKNVLKIIPHVAPSPLVLEQGEKKMNPGGGVLNEKKNVFRDDQRGKGRDCP